MAAIYQREPDEHVRSNNDWSGLKPSSVNYFRKDRVKGAPYQRSISMSR